MKFTSTVALGVALAIGAGAYVDVSPAHAQDQQNETRQQRRDREKHERESAPVLSPAVRAPLVAAQTAIAAQDWATARAKLNEALAIATTPDDKYMTNSMLYNVGRGTNDAALQATALDAMIASGKAPPAQLAQFYLVRGNLAYQAQDYAKAMSSLNQSIQAGATDLNAYALLIETQNRTNQPAAAIQTFNAASEHEKAAGRALPADWYSRAMNIAITARLGPQLEQVSYAWLSAYPTQDNWRDTLLSYREINHPDEETELDLLRLLRTVHGLKGERDYYDYAQMVYLRFPGEGKAVIDEGVSAGMLRLAAGTNINDYSQSVNSRVRADQADLANAATSAKAARDGRIALATGNAYLGYGNWAQAIELYRVALQKGGVDANIVNTRIGMALARSGDLAGAKQQFATITGPRAALAHYWTIWIDNQGRAPAAAAPAPAGS